MITAKYPNPEIGEYLNGLPWKAYCTFTTEYQLSYYRAQKVAENMHTALENMAKTGITMFWVAEPHVDLFRYHIHILIEADIDYSELETYIIKVWARVGRVPKIQQQNRSKIEPFDPQKKGGYYLAKGIHLHRVNWHFIPPHTRPSTGFFQ